MPTPGKNHRSDRGRPRARHASGGGGSRPRAKTQARRKLPRSSRPVPTVVADVMIGDTLRGVVPARDRVVRGMGGALLPPAMAVAACLRGPPYCAEVDSTLEE